MEKILVAEDDLRIREELETLLKANGYRPVTEPPCDLALLDVNLPEESGFDLCEKLKREQRVPVILLTARCGAEDELNGFRCGADDYVKKPFHPAVLLARIDRLLHRNGQSVTARELSLDCAALLLTFRGNSVSVTKNEMRILSCLMRKPLCSKEDLMEALWANDCYVDENALYVAVNRLREKLKKLGAEGYLQTVRNAGYRL